MGVQVITLYEMTEGIAKIWQLVESDDDAPLDENTWAMLDSMAAELLDRLLPAKIASYCGFIRSLEASIDAYKAEEERLYKRRSAMQTLAARLKRNMQAALEAAGVDEIDAGTFRVALQKSPPSVEVDVGREPAAFLVPQPPKLDRRALLEAIKHGAEFDGVRLVQGRHLRIR